jgi:phenylacetic acid degradation operon negative regulatory protein
MNQESNTPLTARSVLASALLGMDPPELPVSQLVRLTGLFGISENRSRVALSRMVAAKEVSTDGAGTYRLIGHLAQRQSRQSASRVGAPENWPDKDWWIVVVTTAGSSAQVRTARRRELLYTRLAELREGVWMRPSNTIISYPEEYEHDFEVMSVSPSEPEALTARLWDLSGWSKRANALLTAMSELPPDGPEALAPGFVLSASVLRHLQADPLLPKELLPKSWPGQQLRSVYDEWDAQYRTTLRHWSRG